MEKLKPTMHEDFKINQRVSFDVAENIKGTGRIIGVSSKHVIFIYIVLLDKSLDIEGYRDWSAIPVSGCHLKKED